MCVSPMESLNSIPREVHCHFMSLAAGPPAVPFLELAAYCNRSTTCSYFQRTTGASSEADPNAISMR